MSKEPPCIGSTGVSARHVGITVAMAVSRTVSRSGGRTDIRRLNFKLGRGGRSKAGLHHAGPALGLVADLLRTWPENFRSSQRDVNNRRSIIAKININSRLSYCSYDSMMK